MYIKMIMVQSLNGLVDQKYRKKWNSPEDSLYLKKEINKSDSLILSRSTYEANTILYKNKNCIILNTEIESIKKNIIYTKYNKEKLIKIINEKNNKNTLLLGGPHINSLLLNDNLIDEISLTIEPIIIKGNKNLFNNSIIKTEKNFNLKSIKKLNNNSLVLNYILKKK